MSLSQGYRLTHKNISLLGYSVAGISTSIVYPEVEACFDVAQGLPYQVSVPNILITHGHMDHASGLPYLIAMKSMTSQPVPLIYMPEQLVRPMTDIMKIWAEIDGHTYNFKFIGINGEGHEGPLKGNYFFRTFPTYHRVVSHGYTILEKKKKLKDEYKNATPHELGRLRSQGLEIEDFYSDRLLSFTGDTKIEFLDSPEVQGSRVLVMEVTYWDKKKSVSNAREWGHIHFDELLPRLSEIKCEKVVLIHASARYTTAYLKEIIDERVPEHLKDKLILFPRPT